jgi:hypothetical protein
VCETLGRFYQVQTGNRAGLLYFRCECGANQSSGKLQQVKWLKEMQPTGADMIPHPLQNEPVPDVVPEKPAEEPAPKAAPEAAQRQGSEPNKAGFIGVAAMVGAVALALLT